MNCPRCGADIDDYARRCNRCGLQINAIAIREFKENKKGRLRNSARVVHPTYYEFPEIVQNLKNALIGSSIIWIAVGCLQLFEVIRGLVLTRALSFFMTESDRIAIIIGALVLGLIGAANIFYGIVGLVKSSKLKYNFRTITEDYRISKAVGSYIWNCFIIYSFFSNPGSYLDIVGIIIIILDFAAILVDILGIRLYVSNNKRTFKALESPGDNDMVRVSNMSSEEGFASVGILIGIILCVIFIGVIAWFIVSQLLI